MLNIHVNANRHVTYINSVHSVISCLAYCNDMYLYKQYLEVHNKVLICLIIVARRL